MDRRRGGAPERHRRSMAVRAIGGSALRDAERLKTFAIAGAVLGPTGGLERAAGVALTAQLPELGRLNRRRIASLAGLAPFACESGLWRGKASSSP